MKRLFAIGLSVAVLGLGNAALAATTDTNQIPSSEDIRQSYAQSNLATETIDGIAIPVGVLRYIQYEHQGHAVTEAKKIKAGGQDIYRLRVDRDDVSNDYNSFYLMYDMNWKLVDEKEITPPPKPEPKPEEKPKPEPEQNDKPEEKPEKPDEKPEGGRGGGGEESGNDENKPEKPRNDDESEASEDETSETDDNEDETTETDDSESDSTSGETTDESTSSGSTTSES